MGKINNALSALRSARDVFKGLGDVKGEAKVLSTMSFVCLMESKPDVEGAVEAAREVVTLYHGSSNTVSEAAALLQLSHVHLRAGNVVDAVKRAQESRALYKTLGDGRGEVNAMGMEIQANLVEGKLDKARDVTAEVWTVFKEQGMSSREAEIQHMLSELFLYSGLPQDAHTTATKALTLARDTDNERVECSALLTIGTACCATGAYQRAVTALNSAIHLSRRLGDTMLEAAASHVAGQVHLAEDQPISASRMVARTIEIYKSLKCFQDEGRAHILACNIRLRQSRTTDATTEAETALAIAKRMGNKDLEGNALVALGIVACRSKMFGLANNYAETAVTIFKELGSSDSLLEAEELLRVVAEAEKRDKEPKEPENKSDKGVEFNRRSFAWRDPTKGTQHRLLYEPDVYTDVKPSDLKRGKYSLAFCAHNSHPTMMPTQVSLRAATSSGKTRQGWCVYFIPPNASQTYGAALIGMLSIISSMIIARLRRLTFVQLGEGSPDFKERGTVMRDCPMVLCTLGFVRTLRLENPTVDVGFVCGDQASWMLNRLQMQETIFNTHECPETEAWYNCGERYVARLASEGDPGW